METPNNLSKSLVKVQSEMRMIGKDGTAKAGSFSYSYATLPQVLTHVLPVLTKHGLAISQSIEVVDASMRLITKLLHESGESLTSSYLLPTGLDSQKMGSAITYARRYSLMAIVSLAAEDEDGDGAGATQTARPPTSTASPSGQVSAKQLQLIRSLAPQKGFDEDIICMEHDVSHLEDLTIKQASEVINNLMKTPNKEVQK